MSFQYGNSNLSLCISASDTITLNAVQNATIDELPTGDAKKAWQNICETNQPATKADQHDLEKHFNHCVLQDETQNLDKWYSKLENIRILLKLDHKTTITDDTMITQILYNTNSKYYDTMVAFLKLEIAKDATTVTLDDVKKACRTVHASITQNNTSDRKHEAALFTRAGPGKHYPKFFKGDCRTCGQKGTNLQIVEKNHQIKIKDRLIGRVKTLLRLCI
jgi:hypothetical protein